jgi:hypothetical protein
MALFTVWSFSRAFLLACLGAFVAWWSGGGAAKVKLFCFLLLCHSESGKSGTFRFACTNEQSKWKEEWSKEYNA